MEIKKIVNELNNKDNLTAIRNYLSSLKFETRFNALRELIYHVDIYLAEKQLNQADALLNVAEKLSRFLEEDQVADKTKDIRSLKIITQKKRAKYFESKGRYQDAINQYDKIMRNLRLPEEETFQAEMLMEIGILEEQIGWKKDALIKFDRASKIYGRHGDDFNFEASLFNCAHVLYDMNFYYKAEEFCRAVIRHHGNDEKMQSPVAHSYLEIANINELYEKNQDAREYYKKALESYRLLNDRVKMGDILNRLGSFEMDDGNFDYAAKTFSEALEIKRTVDYLQGRAMFYEVMGDSIRLGGNPAEAVSYYNAAYHFYNLAGVDGRKIIVKYKIFKLLVELQITRQDMGTFLEKYKKKEPNLKKIHEPARLDYRKVYYDGYSLETVGEWKTLHKSKVNRKFLLYLLRNLCRVHLTLGKDKDYQYYSAMRELVEDDFRKKKREQAD